MGLSGFEELAVLLHGIGEIPDDVVQRALAAGSAPILREMQARVGVRSGNLRNALKTAKGFKQNKKGVYSLSTGAFGKDAPHAKLVEYGHGGPKPAPPHPFARPAYEAAKDEAYRIAAEEVRKWLNG